MVHNNYNHTENIGTIIQKGFRRKHYRFIMFASLMIAFASIYWYNYIGSKIKDIEYYVNKST